MASTLNDPCIPSLFSVAQVLLHYSGHAQAGLGASDVLFRSLPKHGVVNHGDHHVAVGSAECHNDILTSVLGLIDLESRSSGISGPVGERGEREPDMSS
eukprot:765695-Hanusia_phi.AAC.2